MYVGIIIIYNYIIQYDIPTTEKRSQQTQSYWYLIKDVYVRQVGTIMIVLMIIIVPGLKENMFLQLLV